MSTIWNALLARLNAPLFTAFGAPTTWAEVLGFVAGAVCVYLVARQHILNWPIGIANNMLWILLFFTAGLYADSALQGRVHRSGPVGVMAVAARWHKRVCCTIR